ncbi:efflux RND transporter periplasmic adaptor subunit [Brevibacillus invocatus]|uniref:Efflux RND transporter periplasmic adaptor subunit n=1 Tax=Brevibacillus invocatus TaxID=173959 RepID=A0A3M8CHR8_9BACL|nr:efflux RND transporter periplasmic adaptor subunit [Brevibacillus invocatus]RNB75294.1 efflux RND transporter periplasmic adaptor subunit [Brevibacillus invocatus]
MNRRTTMILASLLLVTAGCSGAPEEANLAQAETVQAKVVEVVTVKKESTPVFMELTGIMEAKREAVLPFGTGGTISSIGAVKGAKITEGQLLATLDTQYYQKEVEAASSQVAEAAARKSKTLKGATEEAVEQQRLQVTSAQNQLTKAKQEVETGEKLLAGGAISQSEMDQRRRELTNAEISVKNAQLALDSLLRAAEPEDVAMANASIKQAASQVERAKKSMDDARITAPFAGTVVDVFKQVGEQVSPGEQMIHVVDLSEVKVTLDVTNDAIALFSKNGKVQVVSQDQESREGTITFVSPVIDKQTGRYRVEVAVSNPNGTLRGGMSATIKVQRPINGFLVPLESVGVSKSSNYVMAVVDGVVVKKEVAIGQLTGDHIEILSGINDGDQLLKSGITFYVEGQKVEARGE